MAETAVAEKTQYQGQMHLLQKELMGRYFERVTRAAEKGEGKAVYMLISGNPVELIQAFDLIPVYPEIDALQLAVQEKRPPLHPKGRGVGLLDGQLRLCEGRRGPVSRRPQDSFRDHPSAVADSLQLRGLQRLPPVVRAPRRVLRWATLQPRHPISCAILPDNRARRTLLTSCASSKR